MGGGGGGGGGNERWMTLLVRGCEGAPRKFSNSRCL